MPHGSLPVLMYATPARMTAGTSYNACVFAAQLLLRVALMFAVMISLTAAAVLTAGWIVTQVPALSP